MAYKAWHDGVFSSVRLDTAPSVIVTGHAAGRVRHSDRKGIVDELIYSEVRNEVLKIKYTA
jgi:hypothetical protein